MYRYTSAVRNSDSNSICETLFHIFGMQDSVRKNANEVHDDKCCRKEGNFFRTLVNLFGKAILRKSLFVVWELCRRSLGRLSVFSRWNMARYKRRKRNGNLNKRTFCSVEFFFSSMCCAFPQSGDSSGATLEVPSEALLHPWFVLGL